jgi:CHAT domain-containing protein
VAAADADGTRDFRDAFDAAGGLTRLPASGEEARLVAGYAAEPTLRLGDAATAAYLKHADLRGFDVIHFATHALVSDAAPTGTALALAPSAGESGFLAPGELAALRLGASLVVLSACRSAGGVVVSGEGVQGLTAPFLEAGARAVVATQWRIGDRATVAFVEAFYGALARGLAVGDALRAAKLDAIRRGAPVAEWAAFTVVGDPAMRVPLRAPARRGAPWPVLALAAVGAGGAAALAYRRRGASN